MSETTVTGIMYVFEAILQGVFIYLVYNKMIDRKIDKNMLKLEFLLYLLFMAGIDYVLEAVCGLDPVLAVIILFPISSIIMSYITKMNIFKSINIHMVAYLINFATSIIAFIGVVVFAVTENILYYTLTTVVLVLLLHIIVLIKLYKSNFDYNKLRLPKYFGIIILAIMGILDGIVLLTLSSLGELVTFVIVAMVLLVTLIYGIYCLVRYGRK